MTERLLQYIWQFQYYSRQQLQTVLGEALQVIFPGEHNTNQGPDFKNARIKIGNTMWAGEVELHLKASDWHKHHHTKDAHYGKVILHVVWQNDTPIVDAQNQAIPTLELQNRVSNLLLSRYQNWMQQQPFIACHTDIATVPAITWQSWKERLLIERLEQKAAHIMLLLTQTSNNWEAVFWQMLCRYFGAPVNSDAFEQIARSVTVQILSKHKPQLQQLEALLLGQAGLLAPAFTHPYPLQLQKEFIFLQKKYQLQPLAKAPVFLRMRPVNFPTIRLAQLAMLVHQSTHLFSKIKEADSIQNIVQLLSVSPNHFWNTHYTLTEESNERSKKLGKQTIDVLLINVVIPVLYTYGKWMNEPAYCQKAIQWLELIPAEKNNITQAFTALKVANLAAFDSQALLQLKSMYCNQKRCLECAVGNAILKRDA